LAIRVAIIYLIVTSLWIAFSDGLLLYLTESGIITYQVAMQVEGIKGILFMAITAALLYFVLRYSLNREKEATQQFARLFQENSNPMFIYDEKTLEFLAVNDSALKEYGYSRRAILKMTLPDLHPPAEAKRLQRLLQRPGCPLAFGKVWKHKRKSGATFYVKTYTHNTTFQQREACLLSPIDVDESIIIEKEKERLSTAFVDYKERLDSILSSINDVVWSCDPESLHINYMNDACHRLYGYTAEEFKSDPALWFSIIHPKDRPVFEKSLKKLLQNGSNECEYQIVRKDGQKRYILDRSVVVYNASNEVESLNGVATDITNLRQAQQKMRAYAQRIDEVLNSVKDGFFSVDKNWSFTYVNNAFEELLHRKRENLLGENVWKHFPEAVNSKFFTEYHYVLREQKPREFEEYYPPLGKWFSVSAYPMQDGISVFFHDITEKKLLQERTAEERNKLQTLINSMNQLVWSIDEDMRLTIFNDIFAKTVFNVTGQRPKEGDQVFFRKASPFIKRWQQYYQKVLEGVPHQKVDSYKNENMPEVQHFQVNFYPIHDAQGRVIGASCSATNITDRKNYELKIEQQNKILRRIAWRQSHDVRKPLANILAMVDILRKFSATIPKEEVECHITLDHLEKAANDLDCMIHEITEYITAVEEEFEDVQEENDDDGIPLSSHLPVT